MNHACKSNIVIGYYAVMWMYAYASEHMYYNIQTVKKLCTYIYSPNQQFILQSSPRLRFLNVTRV